MACRIGVLSDTHGHLPLTTTAVGLLAQRQVELVIHCGDVGSTQLIPLFAPWPTHFVLGNADRDLAALEETVAQAGQSWHGVFGQLEVEGLQIAFLHGHDRRLLTQTISEGRWDLVCFGHTHRHEWRKIGKSWLLNPGAVYRARPHSLAIVQLPELAMELVEF